MENDGRIVIDEVKYDAGKVGDSLWIVKRFHAPIGVDDESNYDEATVQVITDDVAVAVRAAIEQGSWA